MKSYINNRIEDLDIVIQDSISSSGYTKIDKHGTVYFFEDEMESDYVVEINTSDIWTYRNNVFTR